MTKSSDSVTIESSAMVAPRDSASTSPTVTRWDEHYSRWILEIVALPIWLGSL